MGDPEWGQKQPNGNSKRPISLWPFFLLHLLQSLLMSIAGIIIFLENNIASLYGRPQFFLVLPSYLKGLSHWTDNMETFVCRLLLVVIHLSKGWNCFPHLMTELPSIFTKLALHCLHHTFHLSANHHTDTFTWSKCSFSSGFWLLNLSTLALSSVVWLIWDIFIPFRLCFWH